MTTTEVLGALQSNEYWDEHKQAMLKCKPATLKAIGIHIIYLLLCIIKWRLYTYECDVDIVEKYVSLWWKSLDDASRSHTIHGSVIKELLDRINMPYNIVGYHLPETEERKNLAALEVTTPELKAMIDEHIAAVCYHTQLMLTIC